MDFTEVRRYCLLVLLLLFLPNAIALAQEPAAAPPNAQATDPLAMRRQALEEDTAAIERLRRELRSLSENMPKMLEELKTSKVTETMVEQARVDAESVRLRQEELQADIANAERRIKEFEQSIRDLESREQILRNPASDITDPGTRAQQLERTTEALAQRRVEIDLERQHLQNLRKRAELADLRLSLMQQSKASIEDLFQRQQERERRTEREEKIERLQAEYQTYLDRAADLSRQLERERDSLSEAERRLLETRIQAAEEHARVIQLDIRLARTGDDLASLESLAVKEEANPKELQQGLQVLRSLQTELGDAETLLDNKITLYERQKQAIDRRDPQTGAERRLNTEEAKLVDQLIGDLGDRLGRVESQSARVEEILDQMQANYKKRLSAVLLERRKIPSTPEEWQQLLTGIAGAPLVLVNQVRLSAQSAIQAMVEASAFRWLGLLIMEVGLAWLVVAARRRLSRIIEQQKVEEIGSFVATALLTFLRLLRKNLLGAGIGAAVLIAVLMVKAPQPGLGIIMTLVLTWVLIKAASNLVWLLLAAPHLPQEKRDVKLYRQLVAALVVGGVLAAIAILARLSLLPENVIGAFDRTFMVYLLLASWPVLRLRRYVVDLLAGRYAEHMWFISLRVGTLVLPLAVFVTATLGVAGYINLAWTVAWHLAVFVLVLVGWLVLRGLINDLVVFLKNFAMGHSGYGLLWTQEIISPLHKIVGMVLFVMAWVALFRAYGWEGDSALVVAVWNFLEQPLFTVGGAQISAWRIIVTVATFLVVIWFGQWIRAVTYRWIYSRIIDLGVRHSLSVFTQYFVVLIGLFVALRIIGVDLTTLTIFAGAVGVGIGFGMQTIANNFISGLLLLIERPLRSGDLVQIGANIGEITRIGIRSLTLKNFDNQEVMIPNSDVITAAFTNWTHSDNTMRTVLMIGVNYKSADPHKIKAIIERVLRNHPWILHDPEPLVALWEYTDRMYFRVQYYLDVMKHNLLELRSQVMFGIWDGFKQENIEVPGPMQELYIREWPEQVAVEQRRGLPAPTVTRNEPSIELSGPELIKRPI